MAESRKLAGDSDLTILFFLCYISFSELWCWRCEISCRYRRTLEEEKKRWISPQFLGTDDDRKVQPVAALTLSHLLSVDDDVDHVGVVQFRTLLSRWENWERKHVRKWERKKPVSIVEMRRRGRMSECFDLLTLITQTQHRIISPKKSAYKCLRKVDFVIISWLLLQIFVFITSSHISSPTCIGVLSSSMLKSSS